MTAGTVTKRGIRALAVLLIGIDSIERYYSSHGCSKDRHDHRKVPTDDVAAEQASTASTLRNIFFFVFSFFFLVNTQLILRTVSHFVKQARWQILTVSPH
jgi:hypothetical protein